MSAPRITLSVIKADIGSIGGHICPSQRLLDEECDRVTSKAIDMRRQSFFGAAMLPMSELEYTPGSWKSWPSWTSDSRCVQGESLRGVDTVQLGRIFHAKSL